MRLSDVDGQIAYDLEEILNDYGDPCGRWGLDPQRAQERQLLTKTYEPSLEEICVYSS